MPLLRLSLLLVIWATRARGATGWSAPPLLDLPFVSTGQSPHGTLRLSGLSQGALTWTVSADFQVSGLQLPLDGERLLEISWTGDPSHPALAAGQLELRADGELVHVDLYAVVGDARLPAAVAWETDAWGSLTIAPLPSAPFPDGVAPYRDASVLVAIPAGFDPAGPVGEVLHLHGFHAVLATVVDSQHLRQEQARSGRNALLVVPQGPLDAADGDFGRLVDPGGAAALLRDAISLAYRDGRVQRPVLGPVVLSSHSGGYRAAAAILRSGGLSVDSVHLFDSLYGDADTFAAFAMGGGRLLSVSTARGGTRSHNQALAAALRSRGLGVGEAFDDASLGADRVIIGTTEASHDDCLTEDHAFARWLRASGLPAIPSVIPPAGSPPHPAAWKEAPH